MLRLNRRELLLSATAGALLTVARKARANSTYPKSAQSMPGLHPGKVVAVHHPGCIANGLYQTEPIGEMVDRGLSRLLQTGSRAEALKKLVQPGERVGIKWNWTGTPYIVSSRQLLQSLVGGLNEAGIPNENIVVYDRYRADGKRAKVGEWLPEGVRLEFASEDWNEVQQDMGGYSRDHFLDLPAQMCHR
jgi:hypothetical protein